MEKIFIADTYTISPTDPRMAIAEIRKGKFENRAYYKDLDSAIADNEDYTVVTKSDEGAVLHKAVCGFLLTIDHVIKITSAPIK